MWGNGDLFEVVDPIDLRNALAHGELLSSVGGRGTLVHSAPASICLSRSREAAGSLRTEQIFTGTCKKNVVVCIDLDSLPHTAKYHCNSHLKKLKPGSEEATK